jgi:pimeloyl-ACP methyl ester carboxylesterase
MSIRKYGNPPFGVAVLHGGPGAPGYMAPVARELANNRGVIEPIQTRDSLEGQLEELKTQLTAHADLPVTLIGSSWGAVLALFLAAREPKLVGKLILIGCAVFDATNSARVEAQRLERMSAAKRSRYEEIAVVLASAEAEPPEALLKEWGEIIHDCDVCDPLTRDLGVMEIQFELHKRVWSDFVAQRDKPGFLDSEFHKITAPAVVIHGEYDPHPIEGIRPFLERCLQSVRFHILPQCGHYPWIERQAREGFFDILKRET